MTDNSEQETKRPLSLARPGGRLELKKPIDAGSGQIRQSFTHGRSKPVTVEVKKKRIVEPALPGRPGQAAAPAPAAPAPAVRPVQTLSTVRPASPQPTPVQARAPEIPTEIETPAAPQPVEVKAPPTVEPIVEAEVSAPPAAPEPEIIKPAVEVEPAIVTPPVAARPERVEPSRIPAPRPVSRPATAGTLRRGTGAPARTLTDEERASRVNALKGMLRTDELTKRQVEQEVIRRAREEVERQRQQDEVQRRADEEARQRIAEETRRKSEEEAKRKTEDESRRLQKTEEDSRREIAVGAGRKAAAKVEALTATGKIKPVLEPEADDGPKRPGAARAGLRKPAVPLPVKTDQRRRDGGKITVSRALSGDEGERMRSLASQRRANERERRRHQPVEQVKVVRDVVLPETITVQELAQRMAERGADVIKSLMRAGVMATINQVIDADTAELIVSEFGHNVKRVAEADVEIGLKGEVDEDEHLESRPPVVTIMGHVDHGKTSLLDALRQTDVVSGEAGGITQHIGAYQVTLPSGRKITFIDTPGHQAFTAMRARGANVTDIVVLVVAADDGIKEQTVEAIRHAKAANAPIIVAINKMDKPGANPTRVREELLQHDIVVEAMGGEVLDVEVSALQKTGLDKLEEAILLQAELLDLRANPKRSAEGVIIEAKLERGRGPVATVLVQRGTLKVGDIFVAGGEFGRVRALVDERGNQVKDAPPGSPVEVLGLNGAPLAGDDFSVVESESRAREITEFRQRRKRDAANAAGGRGTLEEMFAQIASGAVKELPMVVKSDVQGSLEAILASLKGLGTDEVAVRILHGGVGGINESDVNLAHASNAAVIGFNVRANPQARDLARRDNVEIRYYSIIYDVIDDIRRTLEGMLAPTLRENFLGNAQIREIFDITKTGKVAGCYITEGVVRRGAKVRLLRNDIVIHEGALKTLRRFKDDVREVKEGYECGMAFENYTDIQVGDVIECFEIEEIARTL
jgi:translation initiation factor IF-2